MIHFGFCFHLSIFIFSVFCVFSHFPFFSFLGVYSIYFSFLVFYSFFFSFLAAYISLLPFSRFLSLIFLFFLSPICRLHFIYLHHLPLSFPEPFFAHLLVCNFSNHHSLLQIFPSFQSYVISLKDLSVKPQYSKKLIHVTPMDHQTLHITARDKQKFFCCCCCAGKIIRQGIGFFNEGLGNPVEYNRLWRNCECKIYIFFQLQRFLMTNP